MTEKQWPNKEALLGTSILQCLTFVILSFQIVDRFSTFYFYVTMNFRICTWKDEMSLHAFLITRSKVLWACKMPNCEYWGLGCKKCQEPMERSFWDTGTSFIATAWRSCTDFLLQICNLFLNHLPYLALGFKALLSTFVGRNTVFLFPCDIIPRAQFSFLPLLLCFYL